MGSRTKEREILNRTWNLGKNGSGDDSVMDHLTGMHKALDSTPSTAQLTGLGVGLSNRRNPGSDRKLREDLRESLLSSVDKSLICGWAQPARHTSYVEEEVSYPARLNCRFRSNSYQSPTSKPWSQARTIRRQKWCPKPPSAEREPGNRQSRLSQTNPRDVGQGVSKASLYFFGCPTLLLDNENSVSRQPL